MGASWGQHKEEPSGIRRTRQRTWHLYSRALVFAVVVAGTVTGCVLAYILGKRSELELFSTTWQVQCSASLRALNNSLNAIHNGGQLMSTSLSDTCHKGYFFNDSSTERQRHKGLSLNILNTLALSLTTVVQLVDDKERPAFEAQAARAGAADAISNNGRYFFGAKQFAQGVIGEFATANGTDVVPAARRPTYAVFLHWWPETPGAAESAVMLDAFNVPDRRLAMETAIVTRSAVTTATHYLIADLTRGVNDLPAVSLYTPVHRYEGSANDTLANSTTPIVCFSVLSFYWETLMNNHVAYTAGGSDAVFRRTDLADTPPYTFHGYAQGRGEVTESDSHDRSMDAYKCSEDIQFGGSWRVEIYPTKKKLELALTILPSMITLSVALSMAFLLAVLGIYEFGYLENSRIVQGRLSAALTEAGSAHRQLEQTMADNEANMSARIAAEMEYSRRQADLTAMVSHEIRTPINAISGAALLLSQTVLDTDQARPDNGPPHAKPSMIVELLGAGVKNVSQLVADVLEFAIVDKGDFPVKAEAVSIARLVNAVGLMVKIDLDKSGRAQSVDLKTYVDDQLPSVLMTDGQRVQQVCMTLLGNAVKFSPNGGTVDFNVHLRKSYQPLQLGRKSSTTLRREPSTGVPPAAAAPVDLQGAFVVFEVRDEGIGMEADAIERIWEPFRQGDNGAQRRFGGAGLGLTINARIAKALGGHLDAESDGAGHGSTFTFWLPVKVPELAPAEAGGEAVVDIPEWEPRHVSSDSLGYDSDTIPFRGKSAKTPTLEKWGASTDFGNSAKRMSSANGELEERPFFILCAEDDKLSQMMLRKLLSSQGFETAIAGNGRDAVNMWIREGDRADLMLFDVNMPLLSGIDAAREITTIAADEGRWCAPIYALSAACAQEDVDMCLAAGMTGHFSKPVSKSILSKLDALLKLSRANRAAAAAVRKKSGAAPRRTSVATTPERSTSSCEHVVHVTDSVSSGPNNRGASLLLAPRGSAGI